MANDTDACTMTRPLMFGSTWRTRDGAGPRRRPPGRQDVVGAHDLHRAGRATTRTKRGTEAMPMATMARGCRPP